MSDTAPLRLVIADDHPVYREGLRTVLAGIADVEVIAEAANGDEAIELVDRHHVDLIIMDLHMPGTNGIDATRAITTRHPATRVLVLTMLDNDESVLAALRAGASGYLLKGASRAEIARALDAVAHGELHLGRAPTSSVVGFVTNGPGRTTPHGAFPQLTQRERDLLDLMARGLSNPAIAQRLSLSDKTVRNYVSNVLAKIHAIDRSDAIVKARQAGLGGATP